MSRIWFCLLLLLPGFVIATPADGPNSSKECSMCHFRWIDDFLSEEKRDFLMEMPEERVVASEMMCYSCHDGSIADSRLRVWETNRHKSGIKPSDNVVIPDEFPLDDEGKMQCATCHTSHGVDTRVDMASAIFLREANVDSSMCQRCHRDKDDGPDQGNHPVNIEFENLPQAILDAGAKVGEKNKIICETCHTPHGSTSDHFLIIPNSEEGVSHSELCETCHGVSPDISSEEQLRRHSHPVDVEITDDAKLPAEWDNGEKPYLGGKSKINCRTCHSPHNGTKKNHLLVVNDSGDKLCMTCHSSKESILGTKHDIARFNPEQRNADKQRADDGGVCRSCHFMHKGYGPKMWSREMPGKSVDQLCISCHTKGEMAEEAVTGDYTHPTQVVLSPDVERPELPLFDDAGKTDPNGKVACATCHDAHRWSVASDDRGGKDVDGDGNSSFLRKSETKDQALCRECHPKKQAILGSEHDLSLTADKSKNSHNQTLERSGLCGSCHLVHNADSDKLWARRIGYGKDRIEQLCNACHSRGHLAEEKTTGEHSHPLGDRPTFKAGMEQKLPLFTKEGVKSETGGISCATCHDLHSWSPDGKPGPGKKEIEGDRLNSFLRLPNDNEVTLCASCHEVNALILGTDHDLRITAPHETNMEKLTTDESGVCGTCHMVHNAWGNELWSRGIGPGKNRHEALCDGCHAQRKSASKKALHGPKHPMNKRVSEAKATLQIEMAKFYADAGDMDTELPLFTNDGVRSQEGDITCSTCHNPHRWDPEKGSPKAEENLEGDGGNSFLRKSNLPSSGLCTTCHTQKANVINTEHDLTISAPDEKNRLQQTVAESGVCSACHVPHDAMEEGYLLWARGLSNGSDQLPEQICLDCHEKGRVAGEKIVKEFKHPQTVLVGEAIRKQTEGYVPLYDEKGHKTNAGTITCHNPHSWTPDNNRQGPGKSVEGNNRSSFLRFKSARFVCSNCHGIESLRRYKYYHSERDSSSTSRRERHWK